MLVFTRHIWYLHDSNSKSFKQSLNWPKSLRADNSPSHEWLRRKTTTKCLSRRFILLQHQHINKSSNSFIIVIGNSFLIGQLNFIVSNGKSIGIFFYQHYYSNKFIHRLFFFFMLLTAGDLLPVTALYWVCSNTSIKICVHTAIFLRLWSFFFCFTLSVWVFRSVIYI